MEISRSTNTADDDSDDSAGTRGQRSNGDFVHFRIKLFFFFFLMIGFQTVLDKNGWDYRDFKASRVLKVVV